MDHNNIPSEINGMLNANAQQKRVVFPDKSSMLVRRSSVPDCFDIHYHPEVEIVLPLQGEVTVALHSSICRVRAGEALVLPPNLCHLLDMKDHCARCLLLFDPCVIDCTSIRYNALKF